MNGSVVENLSNRKLIGILLSLLVAQFLFFYIGGKVSPKPSSSMQFSMTVCEDESLGATGEWFSLRPFRRNGKLANCKPVDITEEHHLKNINKDPRELVFVAQMPHARSNRELEYSPWFQTLLGLLVVNTEYMKGSDDWQMGKVPTMGFDVRLGYKTKADSGNTWHELSSNTITRELQCHINETVKTDGHPYSCTPMDLFELGSADYPFYLLNLRMPACNNNTGLNCKIGRLRELMLVQIHQNGGFTKVWLSLKTFMFPIVAFIVFWYWRRIRMLARHPYLVEKAIFAVGITMAALDCPIEWFSLVVRTPFMLLVSDIRQGIFYTVLFGFWMIFLGEHLTGDAAKHSLNKYWKHLATVIVASVCMFVFDMCERGVHLRDPFYSIWATRFGANLAYGFIILAAICMCLYFLFIVGMLVRVWSCIKRKRADLLSGATQTRKIKFENVIYRFKFILFTTGICVALTVSSAIVSSVAEGQMNWGDPGDSPTVNHTSAFFTGVFGNWNLYVLLLLALYAPSHKYFKESIPVRTEEEEEEEEELFGGEVRGNMSEEGVTEASSLTTFVKPSLH